MDSFLDKFFRYLRYRKIIKYIPKNSIVCDIGCGKEAYLLKKISHLIKYGIGLDEEVENYKNTKYETKKVKIIEEIPLGMESCETIIMSAFVEHLPKPQMILSETYRILKKQGILILTTPTPRAKPILDFLSKFRLIDENEIKDHKNYFSPEEIKEMLSKSGFKKENIKNYFFELNFNSLIIAVK
jgi:ubiquinone/menaquinone biosynthesis C-methylase UbiE